MGIKERKEREKRQRGNDIIDAAEKVFFGKGYVSSTMDDVAAEAELSIGTLYKYFKNKEDLYLAITKRGLDILSGMFNEAIGSAETGLEEILAFGKAYRKFITNYRNYFNTLVYFESRDIDFEEEGTSAYECGVSGNVTVKTLVDSIERGIIDGSIRKSVDPIKTAIILWGNTTGLLQLISLKGGMLCWKFKCENLNDDEIIEHYYRFVRNALKPE